MQAARTPRSVIATLVVAVLVAAGAVAAAAVLRVQRADAGAPVPSRSAAPAPSTPPLPASGCRRAPCTVAGPIVIAGTTVDLVVDAGRTAGRLRIGGPGSGRVVELTKITDLGVTLASSALQCTAGPISACLVHGEAQHGGGVAGEVVVGRSDKWSELEKPYQSDAGYLALSDVLGDASPEVVAVQYDCADSGDACRDGPVFVQVFMANGAEAGCTSQYRALSALPGYPEVRLHRGDLGRCG